MEQQETNLDRERDIFENPNRIDSAIHLITEIRRKILTVGKGKYCGGHRV